MKSLEVAYSIEKRDLESGLLTPLGGASLDGTLFEITNKSVNAVYVSGALYQPGEVCATIEVVDGTAQTEVRALPYGTYQMVESKPGGGLPPHGPDRALFPDSAKMGRSSSFGTATLPITRSFAATSSS